MKEWGRKHNKRKEKIKRKGRKSVLLSYRHVLLPLTVWYAILSASSTYEGIKNRGFHVMTHVGEILSQV